jgi:hypothetical protein
LGIFYFKVIAFHGGFYWILFIMVGGFGGVLFFWVVVICKWREMGCFK